MTGRAVKEWVGKTPNAKVPATVRLRVMTAANGICYLSQLPIGSKPWELEHVVPLSMGGEHRESNLKPALVSAHREKTSAEATARAKADAVAKKHVGIKAPTKPIQSAGFKPADKTSKKDSARAFYANLQRRPMFEMRKDGSWF